MRRAAVANATHPPKRKAPGLSPAPIVQDAAALAGRRDGPAAYQRKPYFTRAYQNAPLKPNGVYWL